MLDRPCATEVLCIFRVPRPTILYGLTHFIKRLDVFDMKWDE